MVVVIFAALLSIAVPCSANLQSGTENYEEIKRLLRDSEQVGSSPVSPCAREELGCLSVRGGIPVQGPGGSPVGKLWDPPQKRAVYFQSQPRRIALVRRNYLRFGKRSGSYETTTTGQGFRVPPSSGIVPPTTQMSEEEQENVKLRNFVNFFKHFDQVPASSKRSSEAGEPEDLDLQENSASGEMEKRAKDYIRFGKRAQNFIRFGKRKADYLRFGKRAEKDTPRLGKYLANKRKSDNYLRFGKRKSANFIRFGKKNDGVFGTAKFSQDDHSEPEEENQDVDNKQNNFNNDRFKKRKTQNFIRFGKRGDEFLDFGRNEDFSSGQKSGEMGQSNGEMGQGNGEMGQGNGDGIIPLQKRNFKNCAENFSPAMCRRLPQILSLRNSKRMNFLRYGRRR